MSLQEELHQRSLALVKRRPLTLPETGVKIVVRSLMSGDALRAEAAGDAQRGHAIFAFAVEDPAIPGKPMYNWNDQTHRDQLAALHPNDLRAVIAEVTDMMGVDTASAEKNSPGTESFSISSPSDTESHPTSLAAA